MRTILAASMVMLMATVSAAQNTTGSLSSGTRSVTAQAGAPTTGGTTTPAPATAVTPTTPAPTDGTTAAVLPAARDAAIVMCGQDFTTGAGALLVFSASVSANGPAIAPGAPCAQALADLFAGGFAVIDVQPFNQQLQYTLVR